MYVPVKQNNKHKIAVKDETKVVLKTEHGAEEALALGTVHSP